MSEENLKLGNLNQQIELDVKKSIVLLRQNNYVTCEKILKGVFINQKLITYACLGFPFGFESFVTALDNMSRVFQDSAQIYKAAKFQTIRRELLEILSHNVDSYKITNQFLFDPNSNDWQKIQHLFDEIDDLFSLHIDDDIKKEEEEAAQELRDIIKKQRIQDYKWQAEQFRKIKKEREENENSTFFGRLSHICTQKVIMLFLILLSIGIILACFACIFSFGTNSHSSDTKDYVKEIESKIAASQEAAHQMKEYLKKHNIEL